MTKTKSQLRAEAVGRLEKMHLSGFGDSFSDLSLICSAFIEPEFGWTHGACDKLRFMLIDLLTDDEPERDELEAIEVNMWLKGFLKAKEVIAANPEMFGFISLPVDSNGEFIMVGDLIYDMVRDITRRVIEIAYQDDGRWYIHYQQKTGDGLHMSILPQDASNLVHIDPITGLPKDYDKQPTEEER